MRDQVFQALEVYGCFEAILDGTLIPKESLNGKLKQVFTFPLKTKVGNPEKSAFGHSWNPMMPLYERLSIQHVLNLGVIESFSNTLRPDGQPEFSDLVHSHAKKISELDEMALTNGRLPCPYHRVNMGDKFGYSMGFATIPKEGCIIKVPEELVDEDHPLLYKPFDPVKYLEFVLKGGNGGADGCTLESFCGS